MRRREFIAGFAGTAVARSTPLHAQQPSVPVIGYLFAGSPEPSRHLTAAFHRGLAETGYAEGRNVMIEYRWGHNDVTRLPELAADLVRRRVAVVVTPASTPAALAA